MTPQATIPITEFMKDQPNERPVAPTMPDQLKVIEIKLRKDRPDLFNITWNWKHEESNWGIDDDDHGFWLQMAGQAHVIIVGASMQPYLTMALLKRSSRFGGYVLLDPGHPDIKPNEQIFHLMLHAVRKGTVFALVGDDDKFNPEDLAQTAYLDNLRNFRAHAGPD